MIIEPTIKPMVNIFGGIVLPNMRKVNILKRTTLLAAIFLCALGTAAQNCPTPTSTSITFCAVVYASLNPGGVQAAQVGIAFSQTYTSPNMASTAIAAGGGSPTQNGLTVNVGSGTSFTVTGTPSAQANSQWKIAVTYSNGTSATFTVAVQAGAATGVMVNPATANVNQTQTQQFTATELFSNGTTANVTSSATWTLPTCAATGSTVSAGLFTGGGTAGSCTVKAAFGGQNGTAAVTVNAMSNPVTWQTTTLPNGQINQPYPETPPNFGQGVQLVVSGGTSPYTFAVTTGSLPTGLSLSSGGLITGTPTSAGAGSSFAITATDSASHSTPQTFSSGITVASLNTGSSALGVLLTPSAINANATGSVGITANYSDGSQAPMSISTTAASVNACIVYLENNAGTTGNILGTGSCPTTTGEAAVGFVNSYYNGACSGTTMGITSANETFSAATTAAGQTGTGPPYLNCGQTFYATNITGNSADQPTFTISGSGVLGQGFVAYVSGVPTSSILDAHPAPVSSTTGTANNCTPTTFTTTQANEIIIGVCAPNNGSGGFGAPGSPYSIFATDPTGNNTWAAWAGDVSSIQTSITPTAGYAPAQNSNTFVISLKANSAATGTASLASGNTSVATVSGSTVTGAAVTSVQTVTITATSGSASGTATLTVNPAQSNPTITVTPSSATISVTATQGLSATATPGGGQLTVSWASSNTNIATVTPGTGTSTTVTCAAAGTATIQANLTGYTGGSATINCVSAGSGSRIMATDCTPSSFALAWTQLVAGADTIVIPGNTCSWATNVSTETIPANVTSLTIQGSTTVNCSGVPGQASYSCTPSDSTIIEDAYQSNSPLITIAASTGQVLRITGLTIEGGNVGSGSCGYPAGQSGCSKYAMINISGTHNFRFDHNHCDTTTYTPITGINSACVRMYSETEGVLDHNYIFMGNNSSVQNGFQFFNTIGDTIGEGDGSWTVPTAFGTSAFLFAEDNVFVGGAANDCNNAGRFVMRYNTMNDEYLAAQNHSIKYYGGREQGCRASEIYHNYFTGPASGQTNAAIGLNGGPAMIWGNNDAQGYFHLFASGTERGNSGQTEQPAPGSWGYCGRAVNSNGQGSGWDGNDVTTTGWPCLDGLGRGQMLLPMNGQNFPTAAANGCIPQSPPTCSAWPNQELEPMYLFMNTVSSGDEGYTNSNDAVWNRDVYSDCGSQGSSTGCGSAFNGTAGTGFGLLSARPSTCTAGQGGAYATSPTGSYGVGYWATDTNTFYACTSTNTWTAIYTPAQYPQPLNGDLPH